jgi:hypothetical protein
MVPHLLSSLDFGTESARMTFLTLTDDQWNGINVVWMEPINIKTVLRYAVTANETF